MLQSISLSEDIKTLTLSYHFLLKITKGKPWNIRCIYLGEALEEPVSNINSTILDMYVHCTYDILKSPKIRTFHGQSSLSFDSMYLHLFITGF